MPTHTGDSAEKYGIQNGILEYLKEHPELEKQVKISLVAQFDPLQGNEITANKNIYTMQFLHRYGIINSNNGTKQQNDKDGLWRLANEMVKGADYFRENPQESGHDINTFFNDITNLQEGIYVLDGNKWVCRNCK